MRIFHYRAQDGAGALLEGELQAESKREAAEVIRGQMLRVLNLREVESSAGVISWKGFSLNRRHAMVFCRQLAVMADSQPLNQILLGMAGQKGDKAYQEMVLDIYHQVELGHSLSEALKKYDCIFSGSMIQLLSAGEAGGRLPEILERLSCHLERDYAARQKFQAILLYPAILAISALVVGVIMLVFILPSFAAFFQGLSMELPLPTRILLMVGKIITEDGIWILGGGVLFLMLLWRIYLIERFRQRIDYVRLKIPFFGRLRKETAWLYILGTLAVLLESGIRLDAAMGLVRDVTDNHYLKKYIEKMQLAIQQGESLTGILEKCPVFPVLLLQLIHAGESSGRLEEMLQKAADYCSLSAETHTQKMQALLEPALILLLGGIVILFVLAVALPMLDSVEAVGM